MCWCDHMMHMNENSCVKKYQSLIVEGTFGRGKEHKVVKYDLWLSSTQAITSDEDFW